MFISIDHTQFNKHNIILSDKLNNNIMENGFFYRIFYSDTFYSSNGIIINFNLKNVTLENYFNKIKCYHNKSNNQDIINNITTIEKNLIELLFKNKILNKKITPIYKIKEQLNNNFIKIYYDIYHDIIHKKNINLVLKISGLWNTDYECGITFRFYLTKEQL